MSNEELPIAQQTRVIGDKERFIADLYPAAAKVSQQTIPSACSHCASSYQPDCKHSMKRIHSLVVTTALSLVCSYAFAQKFPAQVNNLCTANEEPVFSCLLQGKNPKIVSLCASPASAQGQRSFRYLFGHPSKIELEYPKDGNGDKTFTFTRLIYAGAAGGYAHTFVNDGYKYILYSIEGTGFEHSGLLVQHEGQKRAARDLQCKSSTLVESKNAELVRTTSEWNTDPSIDAHGLPSTR